MAVADAHEPATAVGRVDVGAVDREDVEADHMAAARPEGHGVFKPYRSSGRCGVDLCLPRPSRCARAPPSCASRGEEADLTILVTRVIEWTSTSTYRPSACL
jgi:hypothetical protein